jgi:hypothetical protein
MILCDKSLKMSGLIVPFFLKPAMGKNGKFVDKMGTIK